MVVKINNAKYLNKLEQGMTLVEVLVSVFILAVVLVGTVALFAKCSVFAAELKEHSIVNNALNERMEELRNMSYSSITSLSSSFSAIGFSELDNATGSLTLDNSFSNTKIQKVTLTVSWTSPQGRSLSKSLSAHFVDGGINQQ